MTPFARKVYRIVSRIPVGEVRTYGWVASRAGKPGAGRAVGQLMKRNPYPVVVPCHRVVAGNGGLGGYSGGVGKKKALLELERRIATWLGNKK
ncbi:MAG: MGMT family protein [Candidatus Omnitrophica bacterium]|nr:MGMT family protein [Candidatus Omnitrophota bacterium]